MVCVVSVRCADCAAGVVSQRGSPCSYMHEAVLLETGVLISYGYFPFYYACLPVPHAFNLFQHLVGFLVSAEVADTAYPSGGVKVDVYRKVGEP